MGGNTGGKKEQETEGGRRGTVAIVLSLILLMVLKALAGKQMLFCEMDSIFFFSSRLDSIQSSQRQKVRFQYDLLGAISLN